MICDFLEKLGEKIYLPDFLKLALQKLDLDNRKSLASIKPEQVDNLIDELKQQIIKFAQGSSDIPENIKAQVQADMRYSGFQEYEDYQLPSEYKDYIMIALDLCKNSNDANLHKGRIRRFIINLEDKFHANITEQARQKYRHIIVWDNKSILEASCPMCGSLITVGETEESTFCGNEFMKHVTKKHKQILLRKENPSFTTPSNPKPSSSNAPLMQSPNTDAKTGKALKQTVKKAPKRLNN